MENQGVNDLVRKSVLLVEQHTNEEGVGTGVVHLSEMGDGGSGVNHGDGGFGKDGGEDGGFLEGAGGLVRRRRKGGRGERSALHSQTRRALFVSSTSFESINEREKVTHITKREQDTLEESGRLIQRLLQSLVQLVVELSSVLAHVVSHSLEKDTTEEDGSLFGFQIGDEDFGSGKGGVRSPVCWGSQGEETSPLREGRKEFEGFGKGSGTVAGEEFSDSDHE